MGGKRRADSSSSSSSSSGAVGSVVAPVVLLGSGAALWAALQQVPGVGAQASGPELTAELGAAAAKVAIPALGALGSLAYMLMGSYLGGGSGMEMEGEGQSPSVGSTSKDKDAAALQRSGLGSRRVPPRQAKSAGETVIVVGAGTAGAAAAVGLAERGFKVLLFERDMSLQDRIVGELLQPGGVRALERLGLDDCAKEGIDSVGVDGYVVFTPNKGKDEEVKDIMLKYPAYDPATAKELFGVIVPGQSSHQPQQPVGKAEEKGEDPAGLLAAPKGRSFHNGRFVQRLRERALAEPNVTVVEGIVSKLLQDEAGRVVGVEYKVDKKQEDSAASAAAAKMTPSASEAPTAGGSPSATSASAAAAEDAPAAPVAVEKEVKRAYAPLTVVADGIWSGLRTHVDKGAKPQQLSSFVGLIIEHPPMASPLPHRGCGHVVLAEPSPVLLYQISSTETRVLVDIHGKLPSSATGELQQHLREHILPQLPSVLQAPFRTAVDGGHFKSMPNRAMPCAKLEKDGVLLLGDALNMRHPLTGGGMTVAIRDTEAVLRLLEETDVTDPKAVRRLKATFAHERRAWAATINVLANALHAVFSTPGGDATRTDLRDACFDYLSIGGYCAGGPINLLSGLAPRPGILATHFFLVAFHGVGQYLKPFPTPARLARMYAMLHVACRIIMPLLTVERSTVLAAWPVRTLIGLLFPYGGGV